MGWVGPQKMGQLWVGQFFIHAKKIHVLSLLKQVGLGLSQQVLAYFFMSTFSYASFALTLTIKFLSKLEKSVMKQNTKLTTHTQKKNLWNMKNN